MMKRIFGLMLALVLVCAMVVSAQARSNPIDKVTFEKTPATYTKSGSKLTMNDVSLVAGQRCEIVYSGVISETGSNKALGVVIIRGTNYEWFEEDTGNYYINGSGSPLIGHESMLKKSELPSTANNAGGILSADGASLLNTTYAGGQQIAKEGDLLIPFTLTKVTAPTTGDASNIALWLAMFGLGAAGIVLLSKKRESEY